MREVVRRLYGPLVRILLLALVATAPNTEDDLRLHRLVRQTDGAFSHEQVAAALEFLAPRLAGHDVDLPVADVKVVSPTRLEFVFSESSFRKMLLRCHNCSEYTAHYGVDNSSGEWELVTEFVVCPL